MRIDRVAVNASPLIALFRVGREDLLRELFREVVVPDAVWREVIAAGQGDAAAERLPQCSWAQRKPIETLPRVDAWNLGEGESSVLSYALTHADYRPILDDRAARRCARTLGVAVLGTAGVLVLAKRRGLIDAVEAELRRLKDAGLWLSDELIARIAQDAGE